MAVNESDMTTGQHVNSTTTPATSLPAPQSIDLPKGLPPDASPPPPSNAQVSSFSIAGNIYYHSVSIGFCPLPAVPVQCTAIFFELSLVNRLKIA